MVLMVIFGAGASYDSYMDYPPGTELHEVDPTHPNAPNIEDRPPLAQQLFAPRYGRILTKYRECQGLFPRLRRASSIEEELERLVAEQTHDPEVAVELLALRYYIRDVIISADNAWSEFTSGVTNYAELLQTLRSWQARTQEQVCFTTFNYDVFLDRSWYGVLRRGFGTLDQLVESEHWKLIKVHGSITWCNRVENIAEPELPKNLDPDEEGYAEAIDTAVYRAAILSARQLKWTDKYKTWWQAEPEEPRRAGQAWLPALAIPTQVKSRFECPKEHLDQLQSIIPRATRLLIIGWRGAEKHFLSLWEGSQHPKDLQRIQIVAGSKKDVQEVRTNLESVGVTAADTRVTFTGFSDFLKTDELSSFLGELA